MLPPAACISTTLTDPPTVDTDDAPPDPGTHTFDETNTYTMVHHYDHGGRPTGMDLPEDPDWTAMGGTGSAPAVKGAITYDARGLPYSLTANIDDTDEPIITDIDYAADGQMTAMSFGDTQGGARTATTVNRYYDSRRRPSSEVVTRALPRWTTGPSRSPPSGSRSRRATPGTRPITSPTIQDDRIKGEWPDGYRPAKVDHRPRRSLSRNRGAVLVQAGW